MRRSTLLTLAIIIFILAFFLGRHTVVPQSVEVEKVVYDTIRIAKPTPIHTTYKPNVIRVPIPIFTTTEKTQESPREANCVDSVDMEVVIETSEYRDSSLYAVVSGPTIGGHGPRLEYYETYNKTATKVEYVKEPLFSPYFLGKIGFEGDYFGLGGGLFIKGHHGIGIDYLNISGRGYFGAHYIHKF